MTHEITDIRLPADVDGVFVGGGHNALVSAAYLAKAGQKIVVLEAASRIGGGTTTEYATLPLFKHNLHAYFVRWTPDYAVWRDLDLDRYGARSIFPPVQNAVPFDGGDQALLTYNETGRSVASIAEFSKKDAEVYERLYQEFTELTARVDTPMRFGPPLDPDQQYAVLSKSKLGRRWMELDALSPLDLVRECFEFEPLRSLILFNVSVRGYVPNLDVPGIGSIVALALSNSQGGRLIEGGTFEVARAIAAAAIDAGVTVVTDARVGSIDVSNGRATGVTLIDGRSVKARKFVASATPAPITMLELVGGEHLDPSLRADLAGYRWLEEALFGVHWAMSDRPVFKAEKLHPNMPHALNLALGYESSDDLVAHMMAIRAEENTPDGPIHVSIPTVHDPSQAPASHHTTFGWHFVPGPPMRGKWGSAAIQDRLTAIATTYRKYAPNLDDVTLALTTHSPDATEARVISMRGGDRHHGSFHPDNWLFNRPTPAMPGYRTPIDGLYLCGPSQHPGGSFHGQPGYNAAGVIADDLDLDIWWHRTDPKQALTELA
ncbi:MAG: NAD(P)/FAD-dependent oxidoreductase [Acidimicrobiia bacterium]|nr:NAD(P)/FAD-dependent oxidoreductase [Acidimicrobiia bacterium]